MSVWSQGNDNSVVIPYNDEHREDLTYDHNADCTGCECSPRDNGDCCVDGQLGLHASPQRVMNLGSATMTSTKESTMSHASTPNVFALAAELCHVLVVLCPGSCGLTASAARTSAPCPTGSHRCGTGLRSMLKMVAPDADLRNRTMQMIKRWHKSGGEVAIAWVQPNTA